MDLITLKVSTTWRTDELYLKISGNTKYLYALMDDETRFWIAQRVAETKYDADIRQMFKKWREAATKRSLEIVTALELKEREKISDQ